MADYCPLALHTLYSCEELKTGVGKMTFDEFPNVAHFIPLLRCYQTVHGCTGRWVREIMSLCVHRGMSAWIHKYVCECMDMLVCGCVGAWVKIQEWT